MPSQQSHQHDPMAEISSGRPLGQRLLSVTRRYWDLGFTSFGGPGVHVIILRQRFVEKLKWLDERTFIDLFALGNALPGPGSTQLAFSIAVVTNGVLPGLLAFMLWSLPGALGMVAVGVGVSSIPDRLPGPVLSLFTGLNAAAVGLIALAAFQLGSAAGTDRITIALVWLSASFGICYHAPWMYPVLIAVGGIVTLLWDFRRHLWRAITRKNRSQEQEERVQEHEQRVREGAIEMDTLSRVRTSRSGVELIETPQEGSQDKHASTTQTEGEANPYPSPRNSPEPTPNPNPNRQRHPQAADTTSLRSTRSRVSVQPSIAAVESAQPSPMPEAEANKLSVVSIPVAISLISGFVLLLTIPLATRAGLSHAGKSVPRGLDFFCNIIVAGTIIFGGGPVVIPLLRDYVVVPGWVSSRDFLLIFSILQAFPGPNFNFAVALGFLACPGYRPLGAILGFVGIFSPGILLKLGLLPFYASWRDKPIARSIIRGLNAAASGLVFTAVWQLFLVGYIYSSAEGSGGGAGTQTVSGPLTADPFWAVVSSGAFLACRNFATPPWAAIPAGGLAGLAWYGVHASRQ